MTFAYASKLKKKKKEKKEIQHKDWCQVLEFGLIFFGVSKSNTNILNLNPPHQLLNYNYKRKKNFVINYETSFVTSRKICDIPNISKRKKKSTNFYF